MGTPKATHSEAAKEERAALSYTRSQNLGPWTLPPQALPECCPLLFFLLFLVQEMGPRANPLCLFFCLVLFFVSLCPGRGSIGPFSTPPLAFPPWTELSSSGFGLGGWTSPPRPLWIDLRLALVFPSVPGWRSRGRARVPLSSAPVL